jgi:hypothetical protein
MTDKKEEKKAVAMLTNFKGNLDIESLDFLVTNDCSIRCSRTKIAELCAHGSHIRGLESTNCIRGENSIIFCSSINTIEGDNVVYCRMNTMGVINRITSEENKQSVDPYTGQFVCVDEIGYTVYGRESKIKELHPEIYEPVVFEQTDVSQKKNKTKVKVVKRKKLSK